MFRTDQQDAMFTQNHINRYAGHFCFRSCKILGLQMHGTLVQILDHMLTKICRNCTNSYFKHVGADSFACKQISDLGSCKDSSKQVQVGHCQSESGCS